MKYFTYLFLILILSLPACTPPYKKGDKGFEYKIISTGNGKALSYGNFFEFHINQRYVNLKKDTLLFDTRETMPRIEHFDSASLPPGYISMLSSARTGDSIVMRVLTDSVFSELFTMPSFMEKGGRIYTTVKILKIFENRYQADSTKRAELRLNGNAIYQKQMAKIEKDMEKDKPQIDADSKLISTYLVNKKMKYSQGKWGTFIVVHEEGTGEKIAFNDVAILNYTGKTLDSGKVFDSNVDPHFSNTDPLEVYMSHPGNFIKGLTDGLLQLRKGTKATLYVPSSLAYGKKGKLPAIKANENIQFDIDVINVISEDSVLEKITERRIRDDEARKKLLDSLKKRGTKANLHPQNYNTLLR